MGEITDSVSALEESQRSLDRELAATRRILSEAVGAAGLGMTSAYAVRAAERIKTLQEELAEKTPASGLQALLDQLYLELADVRSVLRPKVGHGHGKAHAYAQKAVELIDGLEAKLAEKTDTSNEDYLRYLKRLNTIDEMLKDAFPGDIATIEARVAAACANTKALSDAQFRLEDTERARASLYDQLNSVEEARESLASQLDQVKKEQDYYKGTSTAQRVRALGVERDLALALKRAEQAEKDRDTWKGMAKDNGAALATALRDNGKALAGAERERDSLQNKLNGAMDDLTVERRMRNKLQEEVEQLRRKSHETGPHSLPTDIRAAALAGKPFTVAGKRYVADTDPEKVLPKWMADRADASENIWINGVLYVPTTRDQYSPTRIAEIRKHAQAGEPFVLEGKRYVVSGTATEKLNNIRRLLEEFGSVMDS
jgi:chromosome segregation ATPase